MVIRYDMTPYLEDTAKTSEECVVGVGLLASGVLDNETMHESEGDADDQHTLVATPSSTCCWEPRHNGRASPHASNEHSSLQDQSGSWSASGQSTPQPLLEVQSAQQNFPRNEGETADDGREADRECPDRPPTIWHYEAEHLLHIARVGCECLHRFCRYLECVDDRRESFIEVPAGMSAGSGVCGSMMFAHAAQLIDATLSLKHQGAWAAVAPWLRATKGDTTSSHGTPSSQLFLFHCDEALELQQHFRDDAGESEATTRRLVWDFLSTAKARWMGELEYIVARLSELLPRLVDPQPGVSGGPEPDEELRTEREAHDRAADEVTLVRENCSREVHVRDELAGSAEHAAMAVDEHPGERREAQVIPRTYVGWLAKRPLPPRHYQLPTRSSMAKARPRMLQ